MKRVCLGVLSVLLAAFAPAIPAAQADVVTFNIQGHATYTGDNSIQSFSGALGVDTATGTVTEFDLQIPFFSEFTTVGMSLAPIHLTGPLISPNYSVGSGYSIFTPPAPPPNPDPILGCGFGGCSIGTTQWAGILLQFTTTNPGSLDGFNGSIINGGELDTYTEEDVASGLGRFTNGVGYTDISGTISPITEPSTWAMMMLGFAGLGLLVRRRKSKPALMAAWYAPLELEIRAAFGRPCPAAIRIGCHA
jgi:PEP-CTERM motif